MYIILMGHVEVRVQGDEADAQEYQQCTLNDGDHFGEIAAIKDIKLQQKMAQEWG